MNVHCISAICGREFSISELWLLNSDLKTDHLPWKHGETEEPKIGRKGGTEERREAETQHREKKWSGRQKTFWVQPQTCGDGRRVHARFCAHPI
jgi:hypothetical protein